MTTPDRTGSVRGSIPRRAIPADTDYGKGSDPMMGTTHKVDQPFYIYSDSSGNAKQVEWDGKEWQEV